MKKLLVLICSFFFAAAPKADAQTFKERFDKMRSVAVDPAPMAFSKPLPVSGIRILDCRMDTAKIGFTGKNGYYSKLTVSGGLQASLQKHLYASLSKSFDTSAHQSLVIVIKNLWLKDVLTYERKEQKIRTNEKFVPMQTSDCVSLLELYLCQDDHYIPLFRVDSTYTFPKTLKKNDSQLLMAPFAQALSRFANLNFSKVAQSKQRLSWQQVDEFNQSRYQAPRFAHDVRQRGLYLTFKDFLQNRVVEKEFEISFGELTDELYIVENKERKLFIGFWGFCDGKKLYVKDGKDFHELIKDNNVYEYWGSEHFTDAPTQYKPGNTTSPAAMGMEALLVYGLQQASKNKSTARPKQLNMETGEAL